jgi:2,5-diketo-D-gluconate reductase A
MSLIRDSRNAIGMPMLGFGTRHLRRPGRVSCEALKTGFRHIDSAQGYQNEEGTGKDIERFLEESGLQRYDIFVTTKL